MSKEKPEEWGWVGTGTIVRDSQGDKYVVQNQRGWVLLVNRDGKVHDKFEALDKIDRDKYQF